ncbi:MAG: efflux RND transporter periplasmic adaptor subunit [Chloroflexi bacterium]|nr:efflux RND transporter periplasmic adaptor subunit [Chloroflexota bacterium]MCL5952326.1 efflux RND transporter periplasmic adaptor subunit [Chloroflexota bacterium]
MSKRNVVIGLVVILILGGGYWALDGGASFGPRPTPTPASEESELDYLVTASGTLLPAKRANLSFKIPGQVVQVAVKQGDQVKRGDVLVLLEAAEPEAGIAMAQANLNQLMAGPTKEEIAVAQANIDAAQAQLLKVRAGATPEEVATAKATLERAQSGLRDAQSAYDKVKDDPAVGMYPQSQALEAAWQEYRIAEAHYNQVVKGATADDIRIAETAVGIAQANLNHVKAGARPEEISVAQARLDQAKAGLAATILTAPFDGTVASVGIQEGETVSPSVPVVTLGDLGALRLETDDLSETSVARVKADQLVNISFEALPGKTFKGKVTEIAPLSSARQGGTNYTVYVGMASLDPALRWGMTGHIEIDTRQ